MDFFDTVNRRHSVRAFKDRLVENEKLMKILEAAKNAPSAGNLKGYKIFAVDDKDKKIALASAAMGQDFISDAGIVLVFCADPGRSAKKYGERGKKLYAMQDATISAAYCQLAVFALGLGSCWIGAFNQDEVLKVLGNPKGLEPVCILPIGYAK